MQTVRRVGAELLPVEEGLWWHGTLGGSRARATAAGHLVSELYSRAGLSEGVTSNPRNTETLSATMNRAPQLTLRVYLHLFRQVLIKRYVV